MEKQNKPSNFIENSLESCKPILDLQKKIERKLQPAIAPLINRFEALPRFVREALLALAEHGWYMDGEQTYDYLRELEDDLVTGKVEKAEGELVKYFESRLVEIEKFIVENFPCRGRLIKAAFRAHRGQEYALSIPVFLSQTEGICMDIAGQSFFSKGEDEKPRTADYADRAGQQIGKDSITAACLSLLAQALPINFSKKDRQGNSRTLNRHAVLHGESLDYDTKANSLQSISLISYVAHVLEREKRHDTFKEGNVLTEQSVVSRAMDESN